MNRMMKLIACVACLFFFYGFPGYILASGTENAYGVVTKICNEDIPIDPSFDENKCQAACTAKYKAYSHAFGHNRCICYYYCQSGNIGYCYTDLLLKGCEGQACYKKCMALGATGSNCETSNTCRCDGTCYAK